jgi:hypothetical protein
LSASELLQSSVFGSYISPAETQTSRRRNALLFRLRELGVGGQRLPDDPSLALATPTTSALLSAKLIAPLSLGWPPPDR